MEADEMESLFDGWEECFEEGALEAVEERESLLDEWECFDEELVEEIVVGVEETESLLDVWVECFEGDLAIVAGAS